MEQKSPQLLSKDFFLQRSFEVAWAVFRVAEYVTRPSLRGALEEKAIAYLLYKDSDHLAGLEEVVRLSIQTNDISSVNGSVLLREMGNLKSFLSSDTYSTIKSRDLAKTPHNAPSVEEVFAKPPMVLSSFAKSSSYAKATEDTAEDTVAGRLEDTAEDIVESSSPTFSNKERDGQNTSTPPFATKSGTDKEKSGKFTPKVRQTTILSFVQGRNLCHIKDLMHSLPDISERTLRYDIQKLVNSGKLERVGSGGPNSFFRLRKNE